MDGFIDELLREKGVPDNLDPEVRQQLHHELRIRADKMISIAISHALSAEQAEELVAIMQADPGNETAVQDYIDAHVPDRTEIVAATMVQFRKAFMGED